MQGKGLWVGVGIAIAILAIAWFFLGFGKGKSGSQVSQVTPILTPTPTKANEASPAEEDLREIKVEGNEFSFSPKSLTLKAEEKIKLTFVNIGKTSHNLTIDELGVRTKTVPPGGTDSVEFTVEKSGTFDFYCSIGNHRALGMEGKVSVE